MLLRREGVERGVVLGVRIKFRISFDGRKVFAAIERFERIESAELAVQPHGIVLRIVVLTPSRSATTSSSSSSSLSLSP